MKVIAEIVACLAQRGAISAGEISILRENGYLPRYEEDPEDPGPPSDDEHELRPDGESLFPVRRRRRGAPAEPLETRVLASRIETILRADGARIAALAQVATSGKGRWERIQGLSQQLWLFLVDPLTEAIESGKTSFSAIWDAIDVDGLLTAVEPTDRGPAASAYRALLDVRAHGDLGKHFWIFKRRWIARAYHLLRAQDSVVQAFATISGRAPALFGKWMTRDPHPTAYWAFVLHHNAMAERPLGERAGESPVRRPWPEARTLARAWVRARALGGLRVEGSLRLTSEAEILSRRLWAMMGMTGSPVGLDDETLRGLVRGDPSLSRGPAGMRAMEALIAARRLEVEAAMAVIRERSAAEQVAEDPPLEGPPWVHLSSPAGWS